MKYYWKVTEGYAELADTNRTVNWETEALCLAETPEQAVDLAVKYDAGQIQPDNTNDNGATIIALEED